MSWLDEVRERAEKATPGPMRACFTDTGRGLYMEWRRGWDGIEKEGPNDI